MWIEHLARGADCDEPPLPSHADLREIDWRDMLTAIVEARLRGEPVEAISRRFHKSVAHAIAAVAARLAEEHVVDTIVLPGGVMQNDLLLADVHDALRDTALEVWTNRAVPPNDGGVSLGQAALSLGAL